MELFSADELHNVEGHVYNNPAGLPKIATLSNTGPRSSMASLEKLFDELFPSGG